MRVGTTLGALALLGAFAAGWETTRPPTARAEEDSAAAAEVLEGQQLYATFCASCHGADLEGQPDWQSPGADGRLPAPPHDASGHTWHHADRLLMDYVLLGGRELMARRGMAFDSGMPGFADSLDERQIEAILAFIKSRWPAPLREEQARRSREEEGGN